MECARFPGPGKRKTTQYCQAWTTAPVDQPQPYVDNLRRVGPWTLTSLVGADKLMDTYRRHSAYWKRVKRVILKNLSTQNLNGQDLSDVRLTAPTQAETRGVWRLTLPNVEAAETWECSKINGRHQRLQHQPTPVPRVSYNTNRASSTSSNPGTCVLTCVP